MTESTLCLMECGAIYNLERYIDSVKLTTSAHLLIHILSISPKPVFDIEVSLFSGAVVWSRSRILKTMGFGKGDHGIECIISCMNASKS